MLKPQSWNDINEKQVGLVAQQILEQLPASSVLILEGDLGAGKTFFAQQFIRRCLPESELTLSPTYSLVEERENILHADLYRISSPEEIIFLELELLLQGKIYFLVEWGERFLKELKLACDASWNFFGLKIMPANGARDYTFRELTEN